MKCEVDRRSFLLGSATAAGAACLASALPWASRAMAAAAPTTLTIERRTIEVKGRAASVFGIRQPNGISGLVLDPGQPFHIDLVNGIGEDTIVHWHGQKPPYLQDGVDDRNVPLIAAGKSQGYDYRPTPGTHWMHSHRGLQEQALLAAPLIVHSAEDLAADVQEVTVLLHDFSFRQPEEILAGLTGGAGGHDMEGMAGMPDMAGMDHSGMGHSGMGDNGMAMPMTMDLNDVEYDAFLANDRTLDDPLVVRVERSGRARLRIINGAASSAFWIELGGASRHSGRGRRQPGASRCRIKLPDRHRAAARPDRRRPNRRLPGSRAGGRQDAANRLHPRLARSGDRKGRRCRRRPQPLRWTFPWRRGCGR